MVIVVEPLPPGADMLTVLGLAASVKPAACTTCCTAGDVLVAKFVSPLYVAVMLLVPTASVEVVNVATPPVRAGLPIFVVPSKKVTVPVGVPLPNPVGKVTVAVKVTDCPGLDGFGEDASAVAVGVNVIFNSTPSSPDVAPQLLLAQLAATMSGLPSPFTSPTATPKGSLPPAAKETAVPKVPSPLPTNTLTFPFTGTVQSPLVPEQFATTMSGAPSPFTSASATAAAPYPPEG
jgi:hypothetical protein